MSMESVLIGYHVRSGTVGGGIISSLFFVLFFNDLPGKIKTNYPLISVDVRLYHKITFEYDVEVLQEDLTYLAG